MTTTEVRDEDPWLTVEVAAVLVLVVSTTALTPFAAAVLHSGRPPAMSLADGLVGLGRVVAERRWGDPASAFPSEVRESMPAAPGWWAAAAWIAAVAGSLATATWRRVDAYLSRAVVGRRRLELVGSRRRTWGRARDLAGATSSARQPNRFTLGRLDGRLVLSDAEAHVALIAPTRSGKTSRYVIPWLLEHHGPAVVTSTKRDVVDATLEQRRARGNIWIWDPFTADSARWSPLRGCEEWSAALAQAQWMADASSGDGDSETAAYWRGEAAKLLAPLLHAAALDGKTMNDVLTWVDTQDVEVPGEVLDDGGSAAARQQLAAVAELDPRNRGTTYMSAASLLAAYRYPELECATGQAFVVEEFLTEEAPTLYVVAGARHQKLLAPLVVGLLSSLLHQAAEIAREQRPLEPTLRLLLDEAANIAPIRDLPAHLSQAAGNGVRIATVWQSLAQVRERYRDAADSILANSTSKLFMGPVTDERTRKYVQGLLGQVTVETKSRTRAGALDGGRSTNTRASVARPAVGADDLQQLERDRTLLIEGARKPCVVRSEPWWTSRS